MNKRVLLSVVLAVFASLSIGQTSVAAPSNPNAPEDIVFNYAFAAGEACAFPIEAVLVGKLKIITLPGNRITITFPGAKITVTNSTDKTKQVTLSGNGSVHLFTQPDGTMLVKSTGPGLYTDPGVGAFWFTGNYLFVPADVLNTPLEGNGPAINICPLIN